MRQPIKYIKDYLDTIPINDINDELIKYEKDDRKGVVNLILRYKKKYENYISEMSRLDKMSFFENLYYNKGVQYIAGVDEVGRGPLAGPVVAAAVILPKDIKIEGINDSKKITDKKRRELDKIIKEKALAYAIGEVSNKLIDEINILNATYKAMEKALSKLSISPDIVLVDAVTIPNIKIKQRAIIKGDEKSVSISAASIIAKVYRDDIMIKYDKIYTEYGFSKNKGYGSQSHIETINKIGLCDIHRKSFTKSFV